jgi:hypothetical protein
LIDKEICKKDIDEVLQMITTLANIYQDKQQLPHKLELENTIEAALSFEIQQNSLTRRYAIENKDDNSHTMASIVTDNVIKTLSQHMSKEHINRNMISRDIVSAGIKKIRKANGFFYGIKDTSKCT